MEKNYEHTTTKDKTGLYKISVKISPKYFLQKREEAIEKLGENVEIKGFRKGQVPANVLEGRFGDQATLQVIRTVSFEIASEIIKKNKEPVLSPLNVKNIGKYENNKPFVFDFEFLSSPLIDIKKLKGIKFDDLEKVEIGPGEVEKVLEEMWQEDHEKVKQELKEGTSADKTTLLGPDGKPISKISRQEKAKPFDKSRLSDDWANRIDPSVKTVTELEDKIKELLKARKSQYAMSLFEHNMFEKVSKLLDIEAPEDLVEAEMVNREEEFYATARLSGASPVEFLRAQGLSIEKLREAWKSQAKNGIIQLLITTGIAKATGIEVTEEEIENEQSKSERAHGDRKEKPEQTRIRLLRQKVIDYVRAIP